MVNFNSGISIAVKCRDGIIIGTDSRLFEDNSFSDNGKKLFCSPRFAVSFVWSGNNITNDLQKMEKSSLSKDDFMSKVSELANSVKHLTQFLLINNEQDIYYSNRTTDLTKTDDNIKLAGASYLMEPFVIKKYKEKEWRPENINEERSNVSEIINNAIDFGGYLQRKFGIISPAGGEPLIMVIPSNGLMYYNRNID